MNRKALGIVAAVGLVVVLAVIGAVVARANAVRQHEDDMAIDIQAPLTEMMEQEIASQGRINAIYDALNQYPSGSDPQGYLNRSSQATGQISDERHNTCTTIIPKMVDLDLRAKAFVHAHPKAHRSPDLLDSLARVQGFCFADQERETDILLTTLYPGTEQAASAKSRLSK
jgi:hypothetical protein